MKSVRGFGYVVAGPAEFVIHRRGGRTRKVGRGISVFCLPLIDRCYLIPSSAQSIAFAADQITAENQGVEVAGIAVWKIDDPQKVTACFDFSDRDAALRSIGENLCNVVESAIRHQVANMTIEDTLRKRGTIILQLKNELAYIAGEWGLAIETVEIRTAESQLKGLRLDLQRELIAREEALHAAQAALETERQRHKATLAAIEDGARRTQIETANMEDRALAFVKQMPAAFGALKVNELNISDASLRELMQSLRLALGDSRFKLNP